MTAVGWALIDYIVDEKGRIVAVEIIDQSEFCDVANDVQSFLSNLSFQLAIHDGKQSVGSAQYFYRLNYSKATKVDPKSELSKQFYDSYSEIDDLFKQNQFDEASEALDSVAKYNVDNLMEQGLYYWQLSQLHYKREDWQSYGELVQKFYYLSPELPDQITFMALQNAIDWFLFEQDYALANAALSRLFSLKSITFDNKTKQQYREVVQTPLYDNSKITFTKKLPEGKVFYRKLVRHSGSIKLLKGTLKKAQLRCGNGVVDLVFKDGKTFFDKQTRVDCRLLLTANSAAEFTLLQSKQPEV